MGSGHQLRRRGSAARASSILANVEHWIAEYHFDGLRIDATQSVCDTSATHILAEH